MKVAETFFQHKNKTQTKFVYCALGYSKGCNDYYFKLCPWIFKGM